MELAKHPTMRMGMDRSILVLAVAVAGCVGADGGVIGDPDPVDPVDWLDSDDGVRLRMRATTAAFVHDDGLQGMTVIAARGGVRSLQLLEDSFDPSPVTLIEYGVDSVEVSYDDGADSELGVVDRARFESGHYTLARLVQAYSRYDIDATRHELSSRAHGRLDSVMVMSDASRVDGVMRDAGHYHSVFHHDGDDISTTMENLPIAPYSFTDGAYAVVEEGEWAVYFPIDLTIAQPPVAGTELVITVNMNDSFRWVDSIALGWDAGVYDFSADYFETVVRFGGNRFDLSWE